MFCQLAIIIVVLFTDQAHSSRCVVTKWNEWGECFGDCIYGLQVRNRNVLRPPFPEIDMKTGEEFTRPCPALHETRRCRPPTCSSNKRIALSNTPKLPESDDIFRDLPIIRSVTSDTGKSPFELSDKVLRPIRKKVIPHSIQTTSQSHRPNCTSEMNSQCCRIVREECPDNSVPKRLIRWFRLPGEQLCRPFHYPHCSDAIERQEKPLTTEVSCLQLCFSIYEKAVLPSLRII